MTCANSGLRTHGGPGGWQQRVREGLRILAPGSGEFPRPRLPPLPHPPTPLVSRAGAWGPTSSVDVQPTESSPL